MKYDFAVIGSGFGGSVAALRLSEKGYRVAVLEQGRRFSHADLEQSDEKLSKLFWMPALRMNGFFTQDYFRHVTVVAGVGVGGGSLGYAAVLLRPNTDFYEDTSWNHLGINWEKELASYYEIAETMLGTTQNPKIGIQDEFLRKTAEAMGAQSTFGPTPNGIYFGRHEELADDPYFMGSGPARMGCHLCGRCLTGCPHGSKNTLDKNYLYLAEGSGVDLFPNRQVINIVPLASGGYQIDSVRPIKQQKYPPLFARKIVVAAGVLGTVKLLFHCRDITQTLPKISPCLGKKVRTNSEAVVAVLSQDPNIDQTRGTTISSHFFPDKYTHITQNRFPRGYTFMKWFMGPLVDGHRPILRALVTLGTLLLHPIMLFSSYFAKNWYKRVTVLTVMQHLDNQLVLTYGRSLKTLFLKRRLKSKSSKGNTAPTYIPVANKAARTLAELSGGQPHNVILESLGNISTTAHILGGCHMGNSDKDGVIDTSHRLIGYPDIYVMSGASVSANIGANPSLTITAMAERASSLIPYKEEVKEEFDRWNNTAVQTVRTKQTRSKRLQKTLGFAGIIVFFYLMLNIVNILQNGFSGWDGRNQEQILGVPVSTASKADIASLSKAEVMQLFYASPPPVFQDFMGEFNAETLNVGVMAFFTDTFTHQIFGPGYWLGKAFLPGECGLGKGYNLFRVKNVFGKTTTARERKTITFMGKSNIDKKDSLHFVYHPYNSGIVSSMRDEIRRINENLYLGMGYMAAGGGSLNPAPFVLVGPQRPWIGADDPFQLEPPCLPVDLRP